MQTGTANVADFGELAAVYRGMVEQLSVVLTSAHWESGRSRHYGWGTEFLNRRRLATIPATDDRTVWEQSQQMRSRPPVDVDVFVPFLVELVEGTDNVMFRHDRRAGLLVSVEQVLVACLVARLQPLTYNWAFNRSGGDDHLQLSHLARRERMRILGGLRQAWGGPLGRLSCTGQQFDDVDSFGALVDAHDELVAKAKRHFECVAGDAVGGLEDRLAHRWIDGADEVEATSTPDLGVIRLGSFNRHDWSFPASWIERDKGTEFGQYLTAGQLLFAMVDRLRRLESEFGLEPDSLVAAVTPYWVGVRSAPRDRLPMGFREPSYSVDDV